MFSDALRHEAEILEAELRAAAMTVATAESCTGGLIVALLTEIPGSSDVVERGFVTYSNAAKEECLGVNPELIQRHGAVSEQVARAMAEGAVIHSGAEIAVAVTGVAGPGGGSVQKPVGLVHMAVALSGGDTVHIEQRFGDIGRQQVRIQTVVAAITMLREVVHAAANR